MQRVLICDDEKDIVSAIEIYLKTEGYEIEKAYNGKEALNILERKEIHLILLDLMMPVMNGIDTINEIRKTSNVPIIFLTAKSEDTDKVLGLNLGADDYITKPFNPIELIARVKSQIRRYTLLGAAVTSPNTSNDNLIIVGPLSINMMSMEAFLDGELLPLTRTEFNILLLLAENPGRVFSPRDIYTKVWNEEYISSESTVAVHIRHLREKIEIDPANPRFLKVVWGRGYKLENI